MAQQLQYAPNERVLCYHGPLIYEAKVLKAEVWDESNTQSDQTGPHFFVHYKGWKQTCGYLSFICLSLDYCLSVQLGRMGPRHASAQAQ